MGWYIQTNVVKGKADHLVKNHNARVVPVVEAMEKVDDPSEAVVCVKDNGLFEAAAYIYNKNEFAAFDDPFDGRPTTWLIMDKDKAKELSGYNK